MRISSSANNIFSYDIITDIYYSASYALTSSYNLNYHYDGWKTRSYCITGSYKSNIANNYNNPKVACCVNDNPNYTLTASYINGNNITNPMTEDNNHTILHMFDNLFSNPINTVPNPPHPISDLEKLQDIIELLNLKLQDANDIITANNLNTLPDISLEMSRVTIDNLNNLLEKSKSHNNILEANIVKLNNDLQDAKDKSFSLDCNLQSSIKDLETSESNRTYLNDHINQQNVFLNEAKSIVQNLRNELSIFKSQTTHLAKQSIKFQNDNVNLISDNNKLSTEIDFLKRDNDKFKNQINASFQSALDKESIIENLKKDNDDLYNLNTNLKKEIVDLDNEVDNLDKKIETLENQHSTLIKNRESLLAECYSYNCQRNNNNTSNDPSIKPCGSCTSCLLKQTEIIIRNISQEKSNLREKSNFFEEVYHIYHNALLNIKDSGIFSRKDIADKALRAAAICTKIHTP